VSDESGGYVPIPYRLRHCGRPSQSVGRQSPQAYGERIQFSVFIVDVKPARIVRLRTILGKILVASEDSVVICELGTVARAVELRIDFLGLKPKLLGQDTIIV